MYNYEVTFTFSGSTRKEMVRANNAQEAIAVIQARYNGQATGISAFQKGLA